MKQMKSAGPITLLLFLAASKIALATDEGCRIAARNLFSSEVFSLQDLSPKQMARAKIWATDIQETGFKRDIAWMKLQIADLLEDISAFNEIKKELKAKHGAALPDVWTWPELSPKVDELLKRRNWLDNQFSQDSSILLPTWVARYRFLDALGSDQIQFFNQLLSRKINTLGEYLEFTELYLLLAEVPLNGAAPMHWLSSLRPLTSHHFSKQGKLLILRMPKARPEPIFATLTEEIAKGEINLSFLELPAPGEFVLGNKNSLWGESPPPSLLDPYHKTKYTPAGLLSIWQKYLEALGNSHSH